MKTYTVALIGNQNSGKTTLFNKITGGQQHIGNFPGITIEKKEGKCLQRPQIHIIDLPGIYSLTTNSIEEIVTTKYLWETKPDSIINIIDASHIERNMYLTLQLLELEIPMILVVNKIDILSKHNQSIDTHRMSHILQIPVLAISARNNQGIEKIYPILDTMIHTPLQVSTFLYLHSSYFENIITLLAKDKASLPYPLFYSALKIVEDPTWMKQLPLSLSQEERILCIRNTLEEEISMDMITFIIQYRYRIVDAICKEIITSSIKKKTTLTSTIDAIAIHPIIGIPVFLCLMLSIFYLTFHIIGAPLQEALRNILFECNNQILYILKSFTIQPWLLSLLQNGILVGITSVLSFLPNIILLFFFLALLEDSGYMTRVVFLMDGLLQKIGLSGSSFVPLILGFGCSVPAILATRTISSNRERKITILLIPFISCSAKVPVYSLIIVSFFVKKVAIVMLVMYSLGIFIAICVSLIIKKILFLKHPEPFLMELPNYQMPTIKNIYQQVSKQAKEFIRKAFTIILLASIIIWFLQNFSTTFQYNIHPSESILAKIGHTIAWLFKPIGFSDWRLVTSLLTGIIAKESVVSTITIVTKATNEGQVIQYLQTLLTPASALSFLTFTLLYVPCIATITTIYKELQSKKETFFIVICQTIIAYVVAYIVYYICIALI